MHTSKKHEGMSLLCMIVTSSQSGDLVAVTRIITRVHLPTVCLWGCGSSRNIEVLTFTVHWASCLINILVLAAREVCTSSTETFILEDRRSEPESKSHSQVKQHCGQIMGKL